jgi:dihydropteroate synthase
MKIPQIMGILNVTPDSFSDGGKYFRVADAVARVAEMIEQGASIIDIGGESSRPGAESVGTEDQLQRVIPVIEGVRSADAKVEISIDTRNPTVAKYAIEAGASIVNDISAGTNEEMLGLVAAKDVAVVLMHMRGSPETMQDDPHYDDVVAEVTEFLHKQAQIAESVGVIKSNIILDPGIGFGKTVTHNLQILNRLGEFVALGYPILLGASRKRFMGAICAESVFSELVGATCATTVLGVRAGVAIFRVHDVQENRQAMQVALATERTAS